MGPRETERQDPQILPSKSTKHHSFMRGYTCHGQWHELDSLHLAPPFPPPLRFLFVCQRVSQLGCSGRCGKVIKLNSSRCSCSTVATSAPEKWVERQTQAQSEINSRESIIKLRRAVRKRGKEPATVSALNGNYLMSGTCHGCRSSFFPLPKLWKFR